MEIRGLPEDCRRNASRPGTDDGAHGGAGPGEPVQLLPLPERSPTQSRYGHGAARRHPADRAGMAQLRETTYYGGTTTGRLGGESEARVSVDAGRQPAGRAQAQVRAHHRLRPRAQSVSEPDTGSGADGREPALDRRYYLHSAGGGVRVPGSDSGCLLAPGDRLGAEANAGR